MSDHHHLATLANGLRVLVSPSRQSGAVAVAVHYDVGFRSEVPGRSGFAHLFEHLMFQGSRNVPRLDHFRLVQATGGTANGSTHPDYTDFYQLVPATALDRVLYLESDRMAAPSFDEDSFRVQVQVVKEEIRRNVHNRPYGGFPWTILPGRLYSDFGAGHDGYGSFDDLDAAGLDDARAFFRSHYGPASAVLTVAGDVDVDDVLRRAEHFFAAVPAGPVPDPGAARSVLPTSPSDLGSACGPAHRDAHAALPAVAMGWQIPDPGTDLDGYVAAWMLCRVLTAGRGSRLREALVTIQQRAVDVSAGCGFFGPLHARAPETLVLAATLHQASDIDAVVEVVDRELQRLVEDPPAADQLRRAVETAAVSWIRSHDDLTARARTLGATEILFGRPALVTELPDRMRAVDAPAVARAAAGLLTARRAVLPLLPGPVEAPIETREPAHVA